MRKQGRVANGARALFNRLWRGNGKAPGNRRPRVPLGAAARSYAYCIYFFRHGGGGRFCVAGRVDVPSASACGRLAAAQCFWRIHGISDYHGIAFALESAKRPLADAVGGETGARHGKFQAGEAEVSDALGNRTRNLLPALRIFGRSCPGSTELPRRISIYPRHLSYAVSQPHLDDAAIRRLRDGGGDERALSLSALPGTDRPFRGL